MAEPGGWQQLAEGKGPFMLVSNDPDPGSHQVSNVCLTITTGSSSVIRNKIHRPGVSLNPYLASARMPYGH